MIIGIICIAVLGLFSLTITMRSAHWHLVARILGRNVAIERAKRKAVSMALGDVTAALARGDASICAQAMRAAIMVAEDDTEETLVKLGFKLPEKIS